MDRRTAERLGREAQRAGALDAFDVQRIAARGDASCTVSPMALRNSTSNGNA